MSEFSINDKNYEDEIDNSELNYTERNICIRLNEDFSDREKRNKLHQSETFLCKKYPKLKEIRSEDRMQIILDSAFPEGFEKKMYIRNLTFTNQSGYDVRILGIRPERSNRDLLEQYLPNKVSLLFKGHILGKEFIVDSVYETTDTEQLDFEVDCTATQYKNPEMIRGGNFLYDILDKARSLTEYTGEKLEEWKEYLDWKEELAKRQIFGCKYYKLSFDKEKKRLIFWLVCESKEYFTSFRKYLGRDIQVFDNDYSNNKWKFEFSGDSNNRKRRYNSVEVGRYRGIVSEYYLKKSASEEINGIEKVDDFQKQEEWEDNYYDEEDYAEDEVEESEEDIYQVFDTPYIAQVAYELNRNDLDEINKRNLDDDEFIQYVYDYVLGNYYSNGFLALSAIGEFVLINRFKQAIAQLERDECYSPNLAMWLFNVERARTSQKDQNIVIDKWLNGKIEKNENQKKAVYKMLEAPDLCLIQGPPGTGKTTVIAEAIYQFVRNGNRVLVASQSNDAVDNALERLADTPEIRAIRLGQKGKRRRKIEDLSTRKFSEDEALKYYYNALSKQVSRNWLNMWDELESNRVQYDTDIRDAELYNQDISELNNTFVKKNEQYEQVRNQYNKLHEELTQANDGNTAIQNEKFQYEKFEECLLGHSDEQFYLSNNMIRIVETIINPLVEKTIKSGIYMTPGMLDIDVMGSGKENACIALIIKNIKSLRDIELKLKESKGKNSNNDGEVMLLQSQLAEAKQKMMGCIMKEDYEGENEYNEYKKYKKKFRTLQKQIDEMKFKSSVVEITDIERHILSKDVLEQINIGNVDSFLLVVSNTISDWQNAIKKSLVDIKKYIDKESPINVTTIINKIKFAEGRYVALKDEIEGIKEQIALKKNTILKLQEKYKIEYTKTDEIIEYIKKLKEENIKKLQEESSFRQEWEKTLRSFKERLDDTDSFKYDQEHYQQIYINACNVVGISCTDNMRNLTDNGYDDFDVVIIDEVSKATPPELLIPLMKARKAILVGDHRQLPPMFKEHEGSYKELTQNQDNIPEELRDLLTENNFNRFKKMVTSSLFKDYFEQADESIKHSLLVQYRMHSDIMDIINRFYEQRLTNGLSTEAEKLEKNHGLIINGIDGSTFIVPDRHAYWIDSSCLPNNQPIYETFINKSTSACNILEKYIVLELLKKIAKEYKGQGYSKENRKTVGVISFYQMQVNEIREAFREAKKTHDFSAIDVDINTVDRFQGKEKNIIITSLVRNNKEAKASKHVVAFERINVAFSRAQELLFIIGAKHMYEKSKVELPNMDMPGYRTAPVYKNIMDDLHRKACFETSNKIITPELEQEILKEYKENGGLK